MKGNSLWGGLAVVFLGLMLLPGCLIVSDTHYEEEGCFTDCYEYEVCQGYCDAFGCWEECWWEETCDTMCNEHSEPPAIETCFSDVECSSGRVCVNNRCQAGDTNERGVGGLCQVCETASDCIEDGALCIRLNYDAASQVGEQVCGRTCEYSHDCPTGFSCINVSDEVGVSSQCLPDPGADDFRTCNSSAELECVRANDCNVGESCVNNSCTAPEGAECTSDANCAAGEECENYECVADHGTMCLDSSECSGSEICIDGDCVAPTQSCVFNDECADDARCVDGQCAATCSESADCGSNERCRQGLCEYIECHRSADCSAGEICVEASCAAGCDDSADCGAGYQCSSLNYCEPDPSVECRNTAECANNQICDGGSCETPCNCNQQCGEGDVCNDDTGMCEDPNAGDEEPALECEDDCGCPSGLSCDAGECV